MLSRTLREVNPRWDQVLEPFEAAEDEVLATPDRAPRWVHLPESGLVSSRVAHGDTDAAALMVGPDDLVGGHAMLGPEPSPFRHVCEVPVRGHRVPAQAARSILAQCQVSRRVVDRCQQAAMADLAQNYVALAALDVPQRLAVWLLQASELLGGNEVPLSQARVSALMGIQRRPSITEAVADYARDGLLRQDRGRVVILDEVGLIRHAGRIVLDWKARRTALAAFLQSTFAEAVVAA